MAHRPRGAARMATIPPTFELATTLALFEAWLTRETRARHSFPVPDGVDGVFETQGLMSVTPPPGVDRRLILPGVHRDRWGAASIPPPLAFNLSVLGADRLEVQPWCQL